MVRSAVRRFNSASRMLGKAVNRAVHIVARRIVRRLSESTLDAFGQVAVMREITEAGELAFEL
jgi:hypothetical protein